MYNTNLENLEAVIFFEILFESRNYVLGIFILALRADDNDLVVLGVLGIELHGVNLVFLGVYLVLLQLRLALIDFLLHDPGLLLDLSLDLSLDLGAKLGNPLLNVDGAGAAGHALHQAGGGAGPSSGHRHN